ncbi:TonB-dependent receptor [Terrimonas sp.]|uniref:SusC/RagA family TonB-linked outer membrane protein n=1 Tax=Terrimonas sp. TaxID=1914338 RepID=UPI000D5200C9|nr:TonB-dependent receptor [Terrimonas sp.]PVD52826.1 TonB-dependent receptor [Terrimonas sp.]
MKCYVKLPVLNYFFLLCSLLFIGKLNAQNNIIKGYIIDAKTNEPIVNAVVNEKGTSNKVLSDTKGFFSFHSVKAFPLTVVITSVGYKLAEEEILSANDPVTFSLLQNINVLNEVVVVGYGTQRRKDLTGSISSVSKKILEYNISPSVDALLGGTVAGLNVTQESGQPGAPATIRIRGGNSVNASNNPLFVIDGFLFFSDNASTKAGLGGIEGELNPLAFLNPSDIESIEVLKDVSATAIYGSRGSNGVILITTKKGKKGGSLIDYQYSAGFANSAKQLDLLNAKQWARLQKDYFLNKPGYSDQQIAALGQGYNWQQKVLQTGITQNHSISISGGDEKSQYFISGNYLNQEGVVLNSGLKRFVGRANYDRSVLPGLRVGVNVTGSQSTQNTLTTFEAVNYNSSPYSAGITNSLTYALYMPPVVSFYTANGGYNYNNPFEYAYLREGDTTANPISDLLHSTAQSVYASLLGNFYAQYKTESGFTAKVSVGTNIGYTTQNYFSPSYTAIGLEPQGIGGIGNKKSQILLSEYTLSYAKHIKDIHFIDVLAGYTYQHTKTNFITTLSSGFTNEDLGVNNLQDGKPYGSRPIFSGLTESRLHSLLGRINYSLLDRYHLTANFRSDYSTRFAKNHKWGLFPSIGLAWNVNEESFLSNYKPLSNLKLRVSAGQVGNQEIGDYEYLQLLEAVYYGGSVAYQVGNSGNENLKWETTFQYNAGIDAGFLNNRLSATVDVYHKKTSDLLIRIPPALGQSNEQLVNVGNLENKGVELTVNALVVDDKVLQWSVGANAAYNVNKITKLYNNVTERILGIEILRVGEPLGSFYGQVFQGIIQKGEDLSKLPTSPSYTTPQPGDPRLKDVNRDGHIDQNDRVVLGSKQPKLIYGFSSSVNFKGFDLFVLLQGAQGNSVYNQLRRYLERPTDAYNASAVLLDSWTESNPSNTVPRITSTPFSSELDSRYIEDASFLRLRTITLGYTVNKALLTARKLPPLKVRVFATAQNLLTITGYKGYDPEVAQGIDLGTFPMPRTFLFGVNISY